MKELKVYPLIGLAAVKAGQSGSYRAWIIARNIDGGSGRLLKTDLYNAIENFVTKRTRQRWIKEAFQIGIFIESKCKKYIRYISVDKVAGGFNARGIVNPILVKPGEFFNQGWHSVLWAGYLESRNDQQPISRATLERITGIEKRTQINLENGKDYTVKYPCKVLLEKVSDPEKAFQDLQLNPDPSIRIEKNKIIKQLPNTYKAQGIKQSRPGAAGKYRKLLNISLLKSKRDPDNKIRVFFKNHKKAIQNSLKYNQVNYCFIRQDSAGDNWFSEVIFN